jgi:L-seryl-tRNA(Ser) seleniumtransferase
VAGVDLVACSADKLLGGPQAGLLLGRSTLIGNLLKHPLARAVRVDKMTLAALLATLDLYLTQTYTSLPVWRMIALTPQKLAERAAGWKSRLEKEGVIAELEPGESTVGGGSLPGERLPTTLLALKLPRSRANAVLDALRGQPVPVIARVHDGRVVLDPRTVLDGEDDALLAAVRTAAS